jgi:hypothetical protein
MLVAEFHTRNPSFLDTYAGVRVLKAKPETLATLSLGCLVSAEQLAAKTQTGQAPHSFGAWRTIRLNVAPSVNRGNELARQAQLNKHAACIKERLNNN